jgi:hypothetical protein
MEISLRAKMYFTIVTILAVGLLFACASPATTPIPSGGASVPPTTTPSLPKPSGQIQTTTPPDESSTLPGRVDVVYFHRPQRCPTCLCFEERIRYVVSTYFQNELDSGQMTFGVYNIGDSKNTDIAKKYNAVGSQLFINTVKNGTDNIKDIQDIWSWSCRTNKAGFDQKVKNVIEQSLKGEE